MNLPSRIDPSRYFDPRWLARELSDVFAHSWLLAAHRSEVAAAGEFTTFDIGHDRVILARQKTGEVRAFHDACRHRGMRLCGDDHGSAKGFACRYHGWRYDFDGRLRAPSAREFPGGVDVEALAPVRCEERFGFLWVALGEVDADLDTELLPIAPLLAAYRPERFHWSDDHVVEIACNWKLSCDVSNEAYHLATLHPELATYVDLAHVEVSALPPHASIVVPLFPGDTPAERHGRIEKTRAELAAAGVALPDLDDAQLSSKRQLFVFPNVQLNLTPTRLELYRHRPHPRDPEICFFDEASFERRGSSRAMPAKRRRIRHGEAPLGPVMGADVDLLPVLQRGMRSRGVDVLRIAESERSISVMHAAIDARMARWGTR